MGSFKLFPGQTAAAALAEVPTGASVYELKERAAIAASKAQHCAAAGQESLRRIWANASQRLERELLKRMRETATTKFAGFADVELLRPRQSKLVIGGLLAVGAAVAYKVVKRDARSSVRSEET